MKKDHNKMIKNNQKKNKNLKFLPIIFKEHQINYPTIQKYWRKSSKIKKISSKIISL